MNYLFSKLPLLVVEKDEIIKKDIPYPFDNKLLVVDRYDRTFYISGNFCSKSIVKFSFNRDNYYFLFNYQPNEVCVVEIKFLMRSFYVVLSNSLKISSNGKILLDKLVEGIKYDCYEIVGSRCFIYFVGQRRFCVCIENEQIKMADY